MLKKCWFVYMVLILVIAFSGCSSQSNMTANAIGVIPFSIHVKVFEATDNYTPENPQCIPYTGPFNIFVYEDVSKNILLGGRDMGYYKGDHVFTGFTKAIIVMGEIPTLPETAKFKKMYPNFYKATPENHDFICKFILFKDINTVIR